MVASMIVRLFGLAVIAGIVVAAMVLWRRAMRNPLFLPAARRKDGPLGWMRIAYGVLGGLLMLGSVYYTLLTVRASYTPMHAPANMMVRMPTTSVETEDLPAGTDIPSARFLATVLIMDARAVEPRPLRVEQFDIRWPSEGQVERRFHFRGMEWQYHLDISSVWLERDVQAGPSTRVTGNQWITWKGGFGRFAETGAVAVNMPADTGAERMVADILNGQIRPFEAPLSVTPATPPWCYSILLISRLSENDPLAIVPIEQFVEANRTRIVQAGIFSQARTLVVDNLWKAPVGGVRLATYLLGVPMLLLVAVAVLLAQVFRRRDLAMVGLLLGIVLYVAAFDRALLSYDLSQLADRSGPLQSRLVACSRVEATFFYKHTALERLAAVEGTEPNMPPLLLDRVNEAEENLLRWWP